MRSICSLLLAIFVIPEDGGSILLQNVGELVPDHTALHSKISYSLVITLGIPYLPSLDLYIDSPMRLNCVVLN
jgi:hypothetical protein